MLKNDFPRAERGARATGAPSACVARQQGDSERRTKHPESRMSCPADAVCHCREGHCSSTVWSYVNPSPVNPRVVEHSPPLEEAFHRRKRPVWISRRLDETCEAVQCTFASVELMHMLKKKKQRAIEARKEGLTVAEQHSALAASSCPRVGSPHLQRSTMKMYDIAYSTPPPSVK